MDNEETITVIVIDREAEEAAWGHSSGPWSPALRTVTISAFCQIPDCGQRRGEVKGYNGCEDGAYYHVNVWANPCGHRDYYPDVLAEARRRQEASA